MTSKEDAVKVIQEWAQYVYRVDPVIMGAISAKGYPFIWIIEAQVQTELERFRRWHGNNGLENFLFAVWPSYRKKGQLVKGTILHGWVSDEDRFGIKSVEDFPLPWFGTHGFIEDEIRIALMHKPTESYESCRNPIKTEWVSDSEPILSLRVEWLVGREGFQYVRAK